MPTRKELIVEKYSQLEKELSNFLDTDIFPNLDDIDVCDVVFLITYQFMNIDTNEQYKVKIKEMLQANHLEITEEKLISIVPLISIFVKWLKQL